MLAINQLNNAHRMSKAVDLLCTNLNLMSSLAVTQSVLFLINSNGSIRPSNEDMAFYIYFFNTNNSESRALTYILNSIAI